MPKMTFSGNLRQKAVSDFDVPLTLAARGQ